MMVAGFPNMLTITGPQSPSVLTNMVSAIEHHVGEYQKSYLLFTRCIRALMLMLHR